jgi:hypothetical protein
VPAFPDDLVAVAPSTRMARGKRQQHLGLGVNVWVNGQRVLALLARRGEQLDPMDRVRPAARLNHRATTARWSLPWQQSTRPAHIETLLVSVSYLMYAQSSCQVHQNVPYYTAAIPSICLEFSGLN